MPWLGFEADTLIVPQWSPPFNGGSTTAAAGSRCGTDRRNGARRRTAGASARRNRWACSGPGRNGARRRTAGAQVGQRGILAMWFKPQCSLRSDGRSAIGTTCQYSFQPWLQWSPPRNGGNTQQVSAAEQVSLFGGPQCSPPLEGGITQGGLVPDMEVLLLAGMEPAAAVKAGARLRSGTSPRRSACRPLTGGSTERISDRRFSGTRPQWEPAGERREHLPLKVKLDEAYVPPQ